MQKISTGNELKSRIEYLEQKVKVQEQELKKNFRLAYESVKPQNLVRNAFSDVMEEPDIRHNVVNTAVGLITGFISRKVIIGGTAGIFRKLAGTAVQYGITKYIAHNLPFIRQKIQSFLEKKSNDRGNVLEPGEI